MFQKATNNMIDAINTLSEEDREYLLNYEPSINRGFLWDSESNYNRIKNILSIKTDSDGHSGASFSICLRSAIQSMKDLVVVQAEEVLNSNNGECDILNPLSD